MEPRQGRPLHARRQLHRLVLVEGVRQGRHHHLGDPGNRLPDGRPGSAGLRAARLPARRRVLLVHLLPDPGAITLRAGVLVEMYREAKSRLGDPVLAWADIQDDPQRRRRYHQARGKGGLVRIGWDEAAEIAAAAHVHTIARTDPTGSPGSRRSRPCRWSRMPPDRDSSNLLGGAMTSFYDWYADLPVASPQVFGDQTDVPESGDWWDASYLMMWGSNVPVTRTPGRALDGRGPLPRNQSRQRQPGLRRQHQVRRRMDAVRAGHRRRDGDGDGPRRSCRSSLSPSGPRSSSTMCRNTPTCRSWSGWKNRDGAYVPGKNLTAADLGRRRRGCRVQTGADRRPHRRGRGAATARSASVTPMPASANGTSTSATSCRSLTVLGRWRQGETAAIKLPRFDTPDGHAEMLTRGVPVRRVGEHLVLHGVRPDAGAVRGAPARPARRLADRLRRPRPTLHPGVAGADHRSVRAPGVRVAREFARNAEESGGRSMIIMGAGICQWFHGDATYRAVLSMLILTGSDGPQRRRVGALRRARRNAVRSRAGRRWRWPPTGRARRDR